MFNELIKKLSSALAPYKSLVYISLAAWVSHIVLRVLLLFRNNPYGFPFVSKPDWYIFHAVTIDFIWICNALLIFLFIGALLNKTKCSKAIVSIYSIFHAVLLPVTILDQEVQRFLGSHLSFGLANTYKDASSVIMFWDYVANDNSVPFLQFFVLALIIPFTYGIYRLLKKGNWSIKKVAIGMVIFYVMSYLFINVIWTGNARMTKLRPVVSLVYNELFASDKKAGFSEKDVAIYGAAFQRLWTEIEGDSLWEFSSENQGAKIPLYRVPTAALLQDSSLQERRKQKPNFIVVFMESQRGLNIGLFNPEIKPSPTPYFDSIAAYSRVWERMHTSSLPTTGGVLTSHTGLPHHSTLAQATDLAHISIPSFASVLTDSGYSTHYFSAADPAWDNLGVWMSKWYSAQHYDRNREDDSTFFDHATEYVLDSLAEEGKPFLATLMTRSNHYPFNFAAGMPEEEKQKPLTDRINYTMNYADRQLSHFMHAIENKEWYKNTYVIILADHGFPLGENGVSTMNGGAFSNATWVPFLIYGNNIEVGRDTMTTSQIDIAPTILELAGIAVPNIFMGHNLLRGNNSGLALGTYFGTAAMGLDGFRYIGKFPLGESDQWMFAESDTHQDKELSEEHKERAKQMSATLDTLIKLSDYSLETGF